MCVCRGEEFRKEYARLGDVRSILSPSVNIMALTATATRKLREEIWDSLQIKNPVIISASPDKPNITLHVASFARMETCFSPIAQQLYSQQTAIGRCIIFCQTLDDCPTAFSGHH